MISRDNKKATIAIGVTNDLLEIFDLVQLVRIASEKMSGRGGGGRPDMALSGGSEPNKAEEAIEVLIKKIKEKISYFPFFLEGYYLLYQGTFRLLANFVAVQLIKLNLLS